jgi:hypothetical protein
MYESDLGGASLTIMMVTVYKPLQRFSAYQNPAAQPKGTGELAFTS